MAWRALTAFHTTLFTWPPIPSAAPFPWEVAKKCQLVLTPCSNSFSEMLTSCTSVWNAGKHHQEIYQLSPEWGITFWDPWWVAHWSKQLHTYRDSRSYWSQHRKLLLQLLKPLQYRDWLLCIPVSWLDFVLICDGIIFTEVDLHYRSVLLHIRFHLLKLSSLLIHVVDMLHKVWQPAFELLHCVRDQTLAVFGLARTATVTLISFADIASCAMAIHKLRSSNTKLI